MKKFGLFILVLLVSIILFGCKGNKEEESKANFNIKLNDYIGINRTYDLQAFDEWCQPHASICSRWRYSNRFGLPL